MTDRLLFLGDVFPTGPCRLESWPQTPIVLNLECPITKASKPHPNKIVLKAEADWLSHIFGDRVRAVCLGNNHIMDYGDEGFRDTVALLDSLDISWFGAGFNQATVRNGIVIEVAGARIGLLGYVCSSTSPVYATADSAGVVPIEYATIRHDIEVAQSLGADRIVVCFHWGAEEVPYPYPRDISFARGLSDMGVDLIIGHHSHCIQPFEIHKKCAIFYGLGNAIMPDLSLASGFDEDGNSAHTYVKRQRPWNRNSLAVEYEPSTGVSTVKQLRFDGTHLFQRPLTTRTRLCTGLASKRHEAAFRRARLWGRFRNIVYGFLKRPRVPRLSHFRQLLRGD